MQLKTAITRATSQNDIATFRDALEVSAEMYKKDRKNVADYVQRHLPYLSIWKKLQLSLMKIVNYSKRIKQIAGHLQAQSYRGKSMPNYQDLESINGGGIITWSQSNKLGENTGAKNGRDRSRTHWTLPMDCYLLDLLLDQVKRGNGSGHTFWKKKEKPIPFQH